MTKKELLEQIHRMLAEATTRQLELIRRIIKAIIQ